MKLNNKLTLISILLFLLFTTSCDIVDSLKNYHVNIPYSHNFSISGPKTSIVEEEDFCISKDSTYQSYSDKVKKVTFLKVAFRVKSFSPSSLEGDVSVYLKDASNNVLFTKNINGAKPGDYVTTPYEFSLSAAEINAIDSYLKTALENDNHLCFTSGLNVQITQGRTTNSLTGAIDIVFEVVTEL